MAPDASYIMDDTPFFSFDEYVKCRECVPLGTCLERSVGGAPLRKGVEVTPEITATIAVLGAGFEASRL